MRILLTIALFFSFNLCAFGQIMNSEELIQIIKLSPKEKLETFKNLAILFTDNLDKRNVNDVDKVFIELLNAQTEIQNNYNDFIWDSGYYNEIESIIYADESLHTRQAIEFEKYVNGNGFMIWIVEGSVIVEKDPDFLVETFSKYVSPPMKSYLKQYAEEIKEPFMEDGGIMITYDAFKQRVVFWDNFEKQKPDFIDPEYVKYKFEYYLYHLLIGADNTPAFDWETKKISNSYLKIYNEIIHESPDSRTAAVLKDYIRKLRRSGYKENDDIINFINKYTTY